MGFETLMSILTKMLIQYLNFVPMGFETRVSKYGKYAILKLTIFWIIVNPEKVPKNSTFDRLFISKK